MAYNGKFVPLERIVEKAFRDAGFENIDWEAAIEWTAEMFSYLGVPSTYIDVTTNGIDDMPTPIEIVDYRAQVPSGLVYLVGCRKVDLDEEGVPVNYAPMIESTDIFHLTQVENIQDGNTYFDPITLIPEVVPDEDGEPTTELSYYTQQPIKGFSGIPYSYKIQGGTIFTNFKDGFIEMSYKSYPLDDRGYPLIPDDLKFQRALEYYIIYKLDWKKWRLNPASPGLKAVLNDSEQKYYVFAASARNKAHIPSIDKMESIKNQWLRSIPKINEHATGFKTSSAQEIRYNQYRLRRKRF